MVSDLESAFASGLLVRPSHDEPNLVHLIRAIAIRGGADEIERSQAVEILLEEHIPPARHIVFILLDGLGMNLLRRMPQESFLARHLRRELVATCPSTTACALTSVATGEYASRHGVTGWYTHLPMFGISIATLPFVERITGQPLATRGIKPEDVVPVGPISPRLAHEPLTIVPTTLTNTPYNLFMRGGTPGWGYPSIQEAIDHIITRIRTAGRPTYTHLYLPEVDSACHRFGVEHPELMALISSIDAQLERLRGALAEEATLIVSADHGLIDVPLERQTLLMVSDPLLELLAVPPSGDARMPIFHVRDGQGGAFRERFLARFGADFILAGITEVERLGLFGPGPLSPTAKRRFGDFIAFPKAPAGLSFHPLNKPPSHMYRAIHAGLSREEMEIPLCVS